MTAQPWELRLAHLEGAFEQLDKRMERIETKRDSRFDGLQWRLTSLIVGTWITTVLAILFHY